MQSERILHRLFWVCRQRQVQTLLASRRGATGVNRGVLRPLPSRSAALLMILALAPMFALAGETVAHPRLLYSPEDRARIRQAAEAKTLDKCSAQCVRGYWFQANFEKTCIDKTWENSEGRSGAFRALAIMAWLFPEDKWKPRDHRNLDSYAACVRAHVPTITIPSSRN